MVENPPVHPFTVELADGGVAGGASSEANAVVLAAALFSRTGLQVTVKDDAGTALAVLGQASVDFEEPLVGPQIGSLDPATGDPGLPPQVLVVNGFGFDEGSVILWDGVKLATTFESESELRARLELEGGVTGGSISVQVTDAQGYASNTVYFTWE
jgi:hypothetical protein